MTRSLAAPHAGPIRRVYGLFAGSRGAFLALLPPGAAHRMMPGLGTPAQRGWVLDAYVRAWMALPEAALVEWAGYVREALDQVRDETNRAFGPDVRAAMSKRLEAYLRADLSREDRAQIEDTIAFVRALEGCSEHLAVFRGRARRGCSPR